MKEPRERGAATSPRGEALRESEEHFRQLVAGVADYAIFLLDERGTIRTWNAGAERIKQYTEAEILGKHFSIFYSPEAIEQGIPPRELELAAERGRFEDEGWRLRKDGSRMWANVVITALRDPDGSVRGFLKITRDLTDRKFAEESLRQSEERFRLLIEGVQDHALFMLDPEGRILSWNVGAQRIKGYAPDEIIGRHFSAFYSAEDVAAGKPDRELREARRLGRAEDEGWRIRKDGTRFWANVVITAMRDPDGTLRGFAKLTRDLTERRRVQALQDADRQKNEFLALLAHELRNPLAPIRTALHIMGQTQAGAAGIARAQAIAERQVEHMSRLLDDLLDVSRVSQGRIELRRENFDLRAAVARTADAIQPIVAEKSQELVLDLRTEPLPVFADPTRIDQVVMNLLSNATKYTESGGHIRVEASREGSDVKLVVRDDGSGIRGETLPRIFELFVQGERRLDRAVGGVGIGLTLVQRLVQLHGGAVEAHSDGPGTGSTFTVRLPAAGAISDAPAPPAPGAGEKNGSLRILVVDDNVDAAESLRMMMEIFGHDARAVHDGHDALDLAARFRPEVIFLDIGMPRMDGYELVRRLRDIPEARAAYVVALTGWGDASDRKRSEEAGFHEHLVKPASPEELQRLLRERQRAAS